jgi:hypothetical protein
VDQGSNLEYFEFTVDALSPLDATVTSLNLLNFSTTLTTYSSYMSGIAADDSYAIYARSLDPSANLKSLFSATIGPWNHIVDNTQSKIGLGGRTMGRMGVPSASRSAISSPMKAFSHLNMAAPRHRLRKSTASRMFSRSISIQRTSTNGSPSPCKEA